LLPGDGEPAQISIAAGDNQSATVGQALALPLAVKVTDPSGRAVEHVTVVFVAPEGAALTPGDTALTDTSGVAQVSYTLSTTAGEQLVEAHVPPIASPTNSSVTFHVSATPESAESLVPVAGDSQSAQVLLALPESLVVQAVDRFGNGVPGVEVTWEAKNGGEVSPENVTTGADGRAATQRMLGKDPGSYGTDARSVALDAPAVSFNATAVAPPSPALVIVTQPSAQARAGLPFDTQPQLRLQDAFGAPLATEGVSVTVQVASGDASLGGKTTAKSDASGAVSFGDLQLRGKVGPQTLIFAAEGFTPVTSQSITLNPGPPAAGHTSISLPDGTAGVRTNFGLHLADQFGNAITGAAGSLSVTIVGANPTSGVSVTEMGDGDYGASYVPVHTGKDQAQVEFSGTPLPGSPFETTVAPGPSDPGHTTADVSRTNGLFNRVSGVVTVRDAEGNPVGHGGDRVQVSVNGTDVTPSVRDNHDGTYSFGFFGFGSQFSVAISLNGEPIQGSPYTPVVQ
jgi:Filamin/ABP280 repeat